MKPPVDTAEAQADIRRFLQAAERRDTARRLIAALCAAAGSGLLTAAIAVIAGRLYAPVSGYPTFAPALWGTAAGLCVAFSLAAIVLRRRPARAAIARRIEKRLRFPQTLSTAVEAGNAPDVEGPVVRALLGDARVIACGTPLHEAAPLTDRRTALSFATALTAGALLAGALLLPPGVLRLAETAARVEPDAVSAANAQVHPEAAETTADAPAQRKPALRPASHDDTSSAQDHPSAPMPPDAARESAQGIDDTSLAGGQHASSERHGTSDGSGDAAGGGDPPPYRADAGDRVFFEETANRNPAASHEDGGRPASASMAQALHGQSPAGSPPPPDAASREGTASAPAALRQSAPRDGASARISGRGDAERRDSAFSPTGSAATDLSSGDLPEAVASDERLEVYATTPNEGRRVRLYVEPQAEREARRARLIDANTDTGQVWPQAAIAPVTRQAIARERAGIVARYLSAPVAVGAPGASHPPHMGHPRPIEDGRPSGHGRP